MEYEIIYMKRKTIAVCINEDGAVYVKCPQYTSEKLIDRIIAEKTQWIESSKRKIRESLKNKLIINDDKINELKRKAIYVINEKVNLYSKLINVEPGRITIGNAKSYWGYCDGKNNINFSWRLMLANEKAIDYVVVHELTHIKHHNHSNNFWQDVEKVIPDYKRLKKDLNELAKKL